MPPSLTHGDDRRRDLDTATGLPPSPAALAALAGSWPSAWADPARRYPAGRHARRVLDTARAAVARAWGVDPGGILFAPDRATAIWWALTGHRQSHPRLAVSAIEDLETLRTADVLGGWGAPVATVEVDPTGAIRLDSLAAALADGGPATVVVQAANIELGVRQDLATVREVTTGHVLVVDQQALAGREPLAPQWDVSYADARMWAGPAGVTVVAVRDPDRFRPATAPTTGHASVEAAYPPVPLIAAAALALESPDPRWSELEKLSQQLRTAVLQIDDCEVVGDPEVGYLTMFTFLYVAADELVDELGRRGWSVASGASCTSDTRRPHHVLVAVGASTHGSLRVSLGPDVTSADVAAFVGDLTEIVSRLRAEAGAAEL